MLGTAQRLKQEKTKVDGDGDDERRCPSLTDDGVARANHNS